MRAQKTPGQKSERRSRAVAAQRTAVVTDGRGQLINYTWRMAFRADAVYSGRIL
jgi:hypothetical protein